MRVHPVFDPVDQLWVTEAGVTAGSLAELQRKLPKATIRDYYPNGYRGQWRPPKPPVVLVERARFTETLVRTGQVASVGLPTLPPVEFTAKGPPKVLTDAPVAPLLELNPRPAPAPFPAKPMRKFAERVPGVSWTPEDEAYLRLRINQRIGAGQIGDELGRTKNSVIGRAHRLGLNWS